LEDIVSQSEVSEEGKGRDVVSVPPQTHGESVRTLSKGEVSDRGGKVRNGVGEVHVCDEVSEGGGEVINGLIEVIAQFEEGERGGEVIYGKAENVA
jgi:hypothetical protein